MVAAAGAESVPRQCQRPHHARVPFAVRAPEPELRTSWGNLAYSWGDLAYASWGHLVVEQPWLVGAAVVKAGAGSCLGASVKVDSILACVFLATPGSSCLMRNSLTSSPLLLLRPGLVWAYAWRMPAGGTRWRPDSGNPPSLVLVETAAAGQCAGAAEEEGAHEIPPFHV
jgi:hypothetical protein